MDNPWSGVVSLDVDGTKRAMSLTLGALAELETTLGDDTLVSLVERFESGAFSSRDVLTLIVAGLRGGGWDISAADLIAADIKGGPMAAAKAAAQLLARAFLMPEERRG
ncbi:gene transfer agent family protein [Planktotalea sp.]|uniref:gene transfer agent family protein n=1 Tax=Planktotalea sp. TaxID=2029877 RepID=UPI00329944B5